MKPMTTNEVTVKTGTMAVQLLKAKYGLDASRFGTEELTDMINLLFPVRQLKGMIDDEKLFLDFLRTVKMLPDSVTRYEYNMKQCRQLYKDEFEQWLQKAVA